MITIDFIILIKIINWLWLQTVKIALFLIPNRCCQISDNKNKFYDQLYVKFNFGNSTQNKIHRCHYKKYFSVIVLVNQLL